jgi:hypothetical protein
LFSDAVSSIVIGCLFEDKFGGVMISIFIGFGFGVGFILMVFA